MQSVLKPLNNILKISGQKSCAYLLVEVITAQTCRKKVVIPEESVLVNDFLAVALILGIPAKRCDLKVLCRLKTELPQGQKTPINVFELVRLILPEPENNETLKTVISENLKSWAISSKVFKFSIRSRTLAERKGNRRHQVG